jgi:outer membrane protein assembly factor BamB
MLRGWLAVLLLAFVPAVEAAQPGAPESEVLSRILLSGEALQTARRLAAADKLAAEEKWPEAIEEYQRILRTSGNDLVPLDANHSIRARYLCNLRLTALPPVALRLYRTRVDDAARRWLEQGRVAQDTGLLRRLVEEAFCSSSTDRALDLLGDLAFERSEFDEAVSWWRMLALPASQRSDGSAKNLLVYPDSKVDVAGVRAKQLLAHLFAGEREGLSEEWEAFRSLHGDAQGHLAGRRGTYVSILHDLAARPENLAAPLQEEAWTTFAGNFARNSRLSTAKGGLRRLPRLDGPDWVVRLDTGQKVSETQRESLLSTEITNPLQESRSLATYPLIVGNRVFVADWHSVSGFDLLTGRRTLFYDLLDDPHIGNLRLSSRRPPNAEASFTLTADEDRLYARLGASIIGPKSDTAASFLVCLNWHGDARERWIAGAPATAGKPAVFEGTPVVYQGRVCCAVTRLAGIQIQTSVVCYDAATGVVRWQQEACASVEQSERRPHQQLLTLACSTLVYCSHTGAIMALDALTGRHLWGRRYPSRGPRTADRALSPRGLAPCVYAGGRLYVAPLDYDRILCVDVETGGQLWESTPLEAIHLLGMAGGRLILTAVSPQRCIRALDAATGTPLRSWLQPADGSNLATYGRGLLADDRVFWPAETGLHVLNLEDGQPVLADPRIRGNLAAADGCLVVAGKEFLAAYLPECRLLDQRRSEAGAHAECPTARFLLARAEADAGLLEMALADFRLAENLTRPGTIWSGKPLRELAQFGRYEALMAAGIRADEAGDTQTAIALFARAAAAEFGGSARLEALLRQAEVWNRGGDTTRAVLTWQSILDDDRLAQGQISDKQGIQQFAWQYAAAKVQELIRAHGAGVYSAVELRARKVIQLAEKDPAPDLLHVARQFPNAEITRKVVSKLAKGYEADLRLAASARIRRLLPDQDLVNQTRTPSLPQPPLRSPLVRSWRNALSADGRSRFLRLADEQKCDGVTSCLLEVQGTSVVCWDANTGLRRWQRTLATAPSWGACFEDMVLFACSTWIESFGAEDGELNWSFAAPTAPSDGSGGLGMSAFRLAGSRWYLGHRAVSGEGEAVPRLAS